MIIGYISIEDPFTDRHAWSGTRFKLRENIEKAGFKVKWIPVKVNRCLYNLIRVYLKIRYNHYNHHPIIYKYLAKCIDWSLVEKCDILFFPGGAQIMNHSPIKKRYIYFRDANFIQMIDYYYYNVSNELIELANQEEKKAIKNAEINIVSSDWAKENSIDFYGGEAKSHYVLEFGPNIDDDDIIKTEPYKEGVLNILFMGVDWERKGGDIAVETVRILREKYKIDARLNIVGIKSLAIKYKNLDFIDYHGFLSKNNPSQYRKLVEVIKQSHLLLLPTKAECAGIVFSEAAAYGLPVLTYNTGGIGNYIIDGINGYKLNIKSGANNFANKITHIIETKEFYNLHYGALSYSKNNLNWKKWSEKFKLIMNF